MRFFTKNFWKVLILGVLLIFAYKFTDSIDYVALWIREFFGIISPVIIGAIIAFFVHRPVMKFEGIYNKVKFKFISSNARIFGLITVYAMVVAVIGIIVNFIVPRLYTNIKELVSNVPKYVETLQYFIAKSGLEINNDVLEKLGRMVMDILSAEKITKYISVIGNIANSFLSFFISIVLSVYIILDKESIFAFFKKVKDKFFDNKATRVFLVYARKCVNLFYSYFSGLAFDAALIGLITAIVLSFFRVPYSVLLGVIVAVGNLIPFFGAIISNIIVYVIVSFSFGPLKALWILLFQFALGQLDGNFIQPKIIGNSVGISPFLVLVSVTVFGGLFGPVGMLIGAPVMAVIRIVVNDILENKRVDSEIGE